MRKNILRTLVCATALVGVVGFAAPVSAQGLNVFDDTCTASPDSPICKNKDSSVNDVVPTIINALLFIVGAISTIMIIVGGIRYTTSSGDAAAVSGAKNTILYSVVGLVVSFMAFAIVNWVLDLF